MVKILDLEFESLLMGKELSVLVEAKILTIKRKTEMRNFLVRGKIEPPRTQTKSFKKWLKWAR